jgi:aspartyl-tRNA(Asn)/glutamyl-tRNA(Gln) amidotransferase subunit B
MEKGHFRCDANVSVHRPGEPWGTRVEIKNLNSFRHVAQALAYEIGRQIREIEGGGRVVAETRTWRNDRTERLRLKEESADYRYFPDPDLPPLWVEPSEIESARRALPGIPLDRWLAAQDTQRIVVFCDRYGLERPLARVLMADATAYAFYAASVGAGGDARAMAHWVQGEVLRRINEGFSLADSHLDASALVTLQRLIDEGTIPRGVAKELFEQVWQQGGEPGALVEARGVGRVADEEVLRQAVRSAISANPTQVARYREGNPGMIGFFMGQVMKATQKRADPELARRLVVEELERT